MSGWAGLFISWACLLVGFLLGCWWSHSRYCAREDERDLYLEMLESGLRRAQDELQMLRDIRQAEWRQKLEAGDA
jgi:hypothetical protein